MSKCHIVGNHVSQLISLLRKGRETYCFFVGIRLVSALARHFLGCKITHEIVGRLEPNLHGYKIGA